jgi:hypothetical protein
MNEKGGKTMLFDIWYTMPPLRAYCHARIEAANKKEAVEILEYEKDMPIVISQIEEVKNPF